MKKIILVSLLSLAVTTSAHASSYVMCHFNSFTAQASGNPMAVTSSNNVAISNETSTPKTYHVTYQMFVDKNMIYTESYTVNVLAYKHFDDNKITTSMKKFTKKGNYDTYCAVTIMGADNNRIKGGGSISIT